MSTNSLVGDPPLITLSSRSYGVFFLYTFAGLSRKKVIIGSSRRLIPHLRPLSTWAPSSYVRMLDQLTRNSAQHPPSWEIKIVSNWNLLTGFTRFDNSRLMALNATQWVAPPIG